MLERFLNMDKKEKVKTLVAMGFTLEEALALATGQYRTVPDTPSETQDPKSQQANSDPEPAPEKTDPESPDLKSILDDFGKTLTDSITNAIIAKNILTEQQPKREDPQDILGLMLEPKAPTGGK